MNHEICYKSNCIVYPIQKVLDWIIRVIFKMFLNISPSKFRPKLQRIEESKTLTNIVGLTTYNALGGILLLFTNIKLANILGASIYGLYSYYLAVGEVGANFVRYGRHKTMTRDLIQQPDKFNTLIANTFILSIVNLLVYLFVCLLFSEPLDLDITAAAILLIIAPCLPSLNFQPVYESIREMGWHSIYNLLQKIIFLFSIWFFIFSFQKPSLLVIGVCFFLSWIIVIAIEFWEIIIKFGIQIVNEVSLKTIKLLYKSNFLIALSCMAGVAFGPLIRLILKNYADTTSVGIYSAGMQIFILSQFLINQIGRVGNPMMAEAGKNKYNAKQRRRFCKKYFILLMLGSLPFFIPLFFFPHFIVNTFFSEEYSLLGDYLPLYGIYLLAFSAGIVFVQFLISMRCDKAYFSIYVSTAIVTLIVSLVLIPIYGLPGAIVSLCIPHTIGCFAYAIPCIKYLR